MDEQPTIVLSGDAAKSDHVHESVDSLSPSALLPWSLRAAAAPSGIFVPVFNDAIQVSVAVVLIVLMSRKRWP